MMLFVLALMGCGETHDGIEPTRSIEERVSWAPAAEAGPVPVATLPAEVVPAPGGRHAVGPGVDGRLVSWSVAPGDTVAAGDPLAELVSPELVSLDARSRELGAVVAQQEERLRLRRSAAERGVASAADVQEVLAELEEAKAAHAGVRRELRAHQDTSTRGGAGWVWRAPVSGVVGELTCSLGTVEASQTCLTLVQPQGVVLDVRVPERVLSHLDAPVQASFIAGDGRSWTFAEVGRAPDVDPFSRSRAFRFAVVGDAAPLQGSSGRATLRVPAPADVQEIPDSALTRIEGEHTVFVRGEPTHEARRVELVGRDDQMAWVRGLAPGERVAVRGVFLLKSLSLLEEG